MKHHYLASFLIASAAILSSCSTNSTPTKESYTGIIPEIRAPQTIRLVGESYIAGYSAISGNGAIVEYFRQGDGPKNWTKLIGLRTINPPTNPEKEARALASLAQSKGAVGGQGFSKKETGEAGVYFSMPKSGASEFNIFRYAPQTGGHGVKSLQYAEVMPKSDTHSVRQKATNLFLTVKIPEIGQTN
ncbi:MAG: hypothetical protein ABI600_11055 [Luteolibacter sp.]